MAVHAQGRVYCVTFYDRTNSVDWADWDLLIQIVTSLRCKIPNTVTRAKYYVSVKCVQ